jgi:hypothetical protein
MSFSSVIALGTIIAAFLLFAVVLAWGEVQTGKIVRSEKSLGSYKLRHETHSGADEKVATPVDS